MLHMHVVIADHLRSDFLCRIKLAGHTPTIIYAAECGIGDVHVVIGLERINEIAARTLVAWLRTDSGARSVALDWKPSRPAFKERPALMEIAGDGALR
jgi:hypothetical protein